MGFHLFIKSFVSLYIILLVQSHSGCFIGGRCQFYAKSIGMTLDDLLHDEIKTNTSLNNQSLSIKMSITLTMIMFTGGSINSILSFITFKNKDLQKVGCGFYLLTLSITSLVTICMFTIKFWFVLLTQIEDTSIDLSTVRRGCISIEPLLKLFVYMDTWLNACIAVERAVNVAKGAMFNKDKSKRVARWIIIILPFSIMGTMIHEPLYRQLFVYNTEKATLIRTETDETENDGNLTIRNETEEYNADWNQTNTVQSYFWCVTYYSHSVQNYNTAILFFHLVVPFTANLISALFIIFGAARQRSVARTQQNYREHLVEQFNEHKQLIISPIILLILALPRLIISLLPGCIHTSDNLWLYLVGYFISFTPSMLVFIVFVLPSELYMKIFKQSYHNCRRQTHQ